MSKNTSVFDVDGKPSIGTSLPLAIQHLLAMIIGNITPCIVVANLNLPDMGGPLSGADTTLLIQSGLLIAGLATLIQLYPVWKFGARLPMIMGVSFGYIPTLISIGSAYGIAAMFGAQLVGGITAILVGMFIKPLRKYFPPVVAGTVVLTIGLSLYTVALGYVGGGNPSKGNLALIEQIQTEVKDSTLTDELKTNIMKNSFIKSDVKELVSESKEMTPEIQDKLEGSVPYLQKTSFGSVQNWILAAVTLLVVLVCNQFGKGYFKLANILIGILAGYAVALAMGMVSFETVTNASRIALPKFRPFGMAFPIPAVISMVIIYIVNSIQAVGDFTGTTMGGMGRQVTDDELSGGIMGSGLSSAVSSFFGGLPIATYSQNVGIVATTKVVSRFVFAVAAIFMLVAGLIPKFGGLMTTIPQAVLGGATITVFGSITMTGIKVIIEDELSLRNTTIVGLAIAIGMGISLVPESLSQFPDWVKIVFGGSAVTIATIIAFVLNIVLPQKSLADEQAERDALEASKKSAK
ncbi:purine permease protein Cpx [Gottschalkia acidurici 9a]|uniref:Purine permease protein Cpx n=1 Tax=Gottschalkia acidurici (strain ATCC 7906 / DSM 604 / BCRC 14475 / CIP 104303 / KCTC 5404 / NCIMB 10678 / 9a) TaxID=1128398 RepID=K0AZD2_GOTA9|nr:nucleobase:cation symporter-2 family protein [Gottschalkia acidurici]AFS77731.1 purine permease protein Cpx [Gottschalkia acidurici 9a]